MAIENDTVSAAAGADDAVAQGAFIMARPTCRIVYYQAALNLTGPQQESPSFLKKRSKRLLPIGTRVAATRTYEYQKFFGSFFQKRTAFFLARAAPHYPSRRSHPLPGLV